MNQPLHSLIIGEGKPLLILHGFLGMLDNWKTLGSRFSEAGWQVHLIDQRNHGNSFWSDEFNYEAMAGDLKIYMDHHGLKRALILGHSMGGKTAMQFACTYPLMTQKLLVADIAPRYYPPHHDDILQALASLELSTMNSRSEADKALSKKITDMGTRQFLLKNLYWKEKGLLALRCNLEVLQSKSAEVGEPIATTATFTGPCLFIRGGTSGYITEADKAEILTHFPSAILQTIPNAGHWLHAEQPDLFFDLALDFINS